MKQRRSAILEHLSQHGHATVQELCDMFKVSMVTMRQDLSALEKDGYLHRTHGGAALLELENISHRLSIRHEKKMDVAQLAASLVEDGETVLLESGSANALLVRALAGRRVQLVVANLFVARQVKHGDLAKVVVVSGVYQPDSESLVGAMARQNIASTFFTKAFLGIDGFTLDTGFTNRDTERAEIAANVVRRCPQTFIVADSSKFGATGMARICGLDDVMGVITNRDLPEAMRDVVAGGKAKLHLA